MESESEFDFGEALKRLKDGKYVARSGWNGPGQYLGLQNPDEHSANTLPYVFIVTVDKTRVPWLASQTDMIHEDWLEVFPGTG
jgi:hypothetical protein